MIPRLEKRDAMKKILISLLVCAGLSFLLQGQIPTPSSGGGGSGGTVSGNVNVTNQVNVTANVTNALQTLSSSTDSVTVSNTSAYPLWIQQYGTNVAQLVPNTVSTPIWVTNVSSIGGPVWTTNLWTNSWGANVVWTTNVLTNISTYPLYVQANPAIPLWTTNVMTNTAALPLYVQANPANALLVTNVLTNTATYPLFMSAIPMIVTNLSWAYGAGSITNTNGAALTAALQFNNYEASGQYQILGATWTGNAAMAGSNQMIVARVFNSAPSVTHVFGVVPYYTAADALKYCGEIVITNINWLGTTNVCGTVNNLNIGVKPAANSIYVAITCWTNFYGGGTAPVNTSGKALWINNQGGQDSLQLVVEKKR